jgi:dipeptidyl aminopeptidase/acylaminoacyl peptidase
METILKIIFSLLFLFSSLSCEENNSKDKFLSYNSGLETKKEIISTKINSPGISHYKPKNKTSAVFNILSLSGASFSMDEKRILFTSNKNGTPNAYEVDIETGNISRLTNEKDNAVFSVSYFPFDDRIIVKSDKNGNENSRLFVRSKSGALADITEGKDTKDNFHGWSQDKRSMFTKDNMRDKKAFDLYKWDIGKGTGPADRKLIFKNDIESPYNIGPVSRDKKKIALTKTVGNADTNLFVHDLITNQTYELLAQTKPVWLSPQVWDHDGKWLYFITDYKSNFKYLAKVNIKTSEVIKVFEEKWDVLSARLSERGKYLLVRLNHDGTVRLIIKNNLSGQQVFLENMPDGDIAHAVISRSESKMAFYSGSALVSENLFLYDFENDSVKLLVDAKRPDIDYSSLIVPELVRFRARDGLEIPGYLYKPKKAGPTQKVPAILWVHGGPGGQTRSDYSAPLQFITGNGYAVFAINNRGSSGYGKEFYHADDKLHGKEPLYDCVDAKRYLQSLEWVDPDKIGIAGRSYGGYMVLAALAFQPEEFAAGIDLFGVSNWVRTLENIPPYWASVHEHLYEEIGNPQKDRDNLIAISPLFHADKIKRPLMVVQGKNDVRVIKPESDDIVEAVKRNGVPVHYLVFDDEGHGFKHTRNEVRCWEEVVAFLDEHLKQANDNPDFMERLPIMPQ